MKNAALLCATATIAILRFAITPRLDLPTIEGSYEAFSHLFVGGLFGAWAAKRTQWRWLAMGLGLSALELVMFLLQKSGWLVK